MIGLLIGCARVSTQEQDLIATATSMIKSAAGAASYLITHANTRADLAPWHEGIIERAGLDKSDPTAFRRVMFAHARKQAGQVLRRRDTREHVALYLKAFNAWATGERPAPGMRRAERRR